MKDILISVIIPAYNVADYLKYCLDSLKNQTYKNWEAIIVDDGSTDDTGAICEDYSRNDGRFHVYHKENEGVSEARNYALQKARGNVLGFADADDYLDTSAFECIVRHFLNDDVDAVYTGHYRVDENNCILETRKGKAQKEGNKRDAIQFTLLEGKDSYLGVLWNKFFRRECCFQGEGFVEFSSSYKIGEDQIWLLEVCKNIEKVSFEENALYYYRIRRESAIHTTVLTDAKLTELYARDKMVEMVKSDYRELEFYAVVKFRNCIDKIALAAIKQRDARAMKVVLPYAEKYYWELMKSNTTIYRKMKESILQILFLWYRFWR